MRESLYQDWLLILTALVCVALIAIIMPKGYWICDEDKIVDYTCKCREGIDIITVKEDWTGRICFEGNETVWVKAEKNKTTTTEVWFSWTPYETKEIEVKKFWQCEPVKECIREKLVRDL